MTDRLSAATVAVVGFGNQGESQALLLRASGVHVIVGARPDGDGARRAHAHRFEVRDPAAAVAAATVIAMLLPDEVLPGLWQALASGAPADAAFVFAHGFNLLYGSLPIPAAADVVLVAPTAPGSALRGRARAGVPAYVAVHHDASGAAWALAESYAARLGCAPLWRTTVREETEVDLFGEQTVLCGGMNALVRAAFEVLVERGYAPEMAYLECVHQLKYLADLLHERGPDGFRRAISATARYGDLTRGPRVIGEASRREMRAVLEEIRSGAFAREWRAAAAAGAAAANVQDLGAEALEAARRRAVGGAAEPETRR